jgi:hypothetical protein
MTPPSALTDFQLFPELPAELRIKIWRIALSTPREVEIKCEKLPRSHEERNAAWFASTTPIPVLLHVCQESRFEALSTYTKAFRTCDSPRYTYVSFERDTIKLFDVVLEYLVLADVKKIQRLVVICADSAYFTHFHLETLQKMEKLKDVDLRTRKAPAFLRNARGDDDAANLAVDFERGRWDNPAWECPRIRIVNHASGEELRVLAGGALVPGWKEGYDIPLRLFLFLLTHYSDPLPDE